MQITKQTIPNTNYEVGRRSKTIEKVIIHWMVSDLNSANAQFKKVGGGTSAHYGIENDTVYQWVDEANTGYHAGNFNVNLESVGIEHSASPDRPASEQTYKTSGELVAQIAKRYNIPLDRAHIMRHGEVVATQCCGTVDVDKIISYAKGGPMDNESNTDKQVQFDRMLTHLRIKNFIATDASEKFTKPVRPDGLLKLLVEIWNDREIDRPKASKWDTICLKVGLSNTATVDEVAVELQPSVAKIAQARENGRIDGLKQAVETVKKLF